MVWALGEQDDRALNTTHCPSIRAREDALAGGSHICRPVKKIVYCLPGVLRKPKPQVSSGEGGHPRPNGGWPCSSCNRHRFFDLIPLPSEPLPLCRLCRGFRRLPTVPTGTGAIALILCHETYMPARPSCFTIYRHCKIRPVELSAWIRAVK